MSINTEDVPFDPPGNVYDPRRPDVRWPALSMRHVYIQLASRAYPAPLRYLARWAEARCVEAP